MFENDTVVEQDTAPADNDTVWLTKEDLVGETVVLGLVDYDADYPGKYGPTARSVVDLFVVTGEHAGTLQPGTHLYANIGSQASAIGVGNTSVAIVETGTSKKGNPWYGLNFVVPAKTYKAALTAARKAAGPSAPAESSAAAPF